MSSNLSDPIMTQTVDGTVYHITGIDLNHFNPVKGKLSHYDLSEMRKVPTVLFETARSIVSWAIKEAEEFIRWIIIPENLKCTRS